MMLFDEMVFFGDMDFFSAPLGENDVAALQTEPEATVEDDYSDEEIDVDEFERRMWRDKLRLKRPKEQSKGKEGADGSKQRQSQEQVGKKKFDLNYWMTAMEVEEILGRVKISAACHWGDRKLMTLGELFRRLRWHRYETVGFQGFKECNLFDVILALEEMEAQWKVE